MIFAVTVLGLVAVCAVVVYPGIWWTPCGEEGLTVAALRRRLELEAYCRGPIGSGSFGRGGTAVARRASYTPRGRSRGDLREASVIRKAATAALAAAAVLVVGAGCSSSTSGTAAPETSDPKAATEALWDPCTLDAATVDQMQVDPSTRKSDIAGQASVEGFKKCTWHDTPWTYSVNVWSTVHSVDDYRQKEAGADFQTVTIGGRSGVKYVPAEDSSGDQCFVQFPAGHGSYIVSVLRQDPNSAEAPCDRATAAASAVVGALPQ